jgi:protein-disulfide isomerase
MAKTKEEVRVVNANVQKGPMSVASAILIGSLIISVSILIGTGVIKLKGVSVGSNNGTLPTATASTEPTPQGPEIPAGPVKISIDDDPVLGNTDAPVTLIEFSDYECPFCKRHYTTTYPELLKNYINTGKVKLVFRDMPLTFHDPLATFEAMAANCVREQGGDSAYFKMHDELFNKTTSNGNGLTEDAVLKIAADLGYNSGLVKSCIDSDKYKDEIAKDITDGNNAGATGTPSFFVGKSDSSGTIEGTLIVGALPYTEFSKEIDALLK